MFPLYFSSTLASQGSLFTFILKKSQSFVVLCLLGCHSFPLTLSLDIGILSGSPVNPWILDIAYLFLVYINHWFFFSNMEQSLCQYINFFFFFLACHSCGVGNPNWTNLSFKLMAMLLVGSFLFLGTRSLISLQHVSIRRSPSTHLLPRHPFYQYFSLVLSNFLTPAH